MAGGAQQRVHQGGAAAAGGRTRRVEACNAPAAATAVRLGTGDLQPQSHQSSADYELCLLVQETVRFHSSTCRVSAFQCWALISTPPRRCAPLVLPRFVQFQVDYDLPTPAELLMAVRHSF